MTASPATPNPPPAEPSAVFFNSYQRARLLLSVASIAAIVLFWYAGGSAHIPYNKHFGLSLLRQPNITVTFLTVALCLMLSLLIGTIVAGRIRYDAGLCAACLGLLALSLRAGPVRYTLFLSGGSPSIYLTFAVELALLFALVGAASVLQNFFHSVGFLKDDVFRDGVADTVFPLATKLQAAATQVITMALVVYFLGVTDQKNQALAALAIGSFAGTALAYYLFPVRPSFWFWIGPLVVGAAGYLWAYSSPGDLTIGVPANPFAVALPVDYASAAVASAIVAYWMSRRWKRDRDAQSTDPEAESVPPTPAAPAVIPPRPQRFDADLD